MILRAKGQSPEYEVSDEIPPQNENLIVLAGDIVSAYVSNNSVPIAELASLITSVHQALTHLTGEAAPAVVEETVEKPSPAQIRKSITDNAIISFIDGKSYKTLKRHLGTHGLDPHSYRQRYGLPTDYPMVAPSYAAQRSALAKQIGLGRPGAQQERADAAQEETKGRGRRKVA